ncbi:MAG: ribosome-associated translation inhibitor RaiA [Planctomycetota bacterium]
MEIHISFQHVEMTDAIRAYVEEKVGRLEHISGRVVGAHVALLHDHARSPQKAYIAKVHLAFPGPDIHAEDAERDLYAAIDRVTDKLAQRLRHRKTRLKDNRIREARKVKFRRTDE